MHPLKAEKIEEGRYNITSLPCVVCKHEAVLEITGQELYAYNQGISIVKILTGKGVDAGVRERFISGVCPNCWGEMFPEEPYIEEE